jgi:4-hydroxybenzoate polyprenyltransferase
MKSILSYLLGAATTSSVFLAVMFGVLGQLTTLLWILAAMFVILSFSFLVKYIDKKYQEEEGN